MPDHRPLLLAAALLLMVPTNAAARPLARPPAPPRPPLVLHEPCPSGGGSCADPYAGVIYLAYRDRFALEHELGHIFDAQVLTTESRATITALLRYPRSTPWGIGTDCAACPSERFADAYAACRLGIRRERYHGVTSWTASYGYFPTPRQHYRICATLRRLGTR